MSKIHIKHEKKTETVSGHGTKFENVFEMQKNPDPKKIMLFSELKVKGPIHCHL